MSNISTTEVDINENDLIVNYTSGSFNKTGKKNKLSSKIKYPTSSIIPENESFSINEQFLLINELTITIN